MGELHMGPGWAAFSDPEQYLRYGLILLLATVSGAVLAFHPASLSRAATLDDHQHRSTLIVYAVVGAMIAVICSANPSMAFVIFGIGGLMRFRTQLGGSGQTGSTIMATLVGLCWGLGLEMVAALATLYFWVLIWALSLLRVLQLDVGGVAVADMERAAQAYRDAIAAAGGRVSSSKKNFKKQQLSFVFRTPKGVGVEDVARLVQDIPDELRGIPDWPD